MNYYRAKLHHRNLASLNVPNINTKTFQNENRRPNFENFVKLLKEGDILVDIRIGQYPDGRPHDHGTGFRVLPDKLEFCFSYRERII